MLDRYQMTKDILALADSSPLNNVDIAPIIAKYSEGEELNIQKKVRVTIMDILRELKKSGDIEYYEGWFNITVSTGGNFWSSSGLIRSTHQRQKELEKTKPANQDFLAVETPQNHPNKAAKKITTKTMIISFWDVISKNPLISALTALILGTLILKYFHVI